MVKEQLRIKIIIKRFKGYEVFLGLSQFPKKEC